MKKSLQRISRFKTAVPQSWWNRMRTRIAAGVGIPVAFAASLFAATPAMAEEASIVDTTTPTTMEQVDTTFVSDELPEVEMAPVSVETIITDSTFEGASASEDATVESSAEVKQEESGSSATEESQETTITSEESSTETKQEESYTSEQTNQVEGIVSENPVTVSTVPTVSETTVTETTTEGETTVETTTTTRTESYTEYTFFIQDGIVNIVGEISEDDLAKINEALIKRFGDNIPEVRIWSGLEQGVNQLGSTGVIVTLSEEGQIEIKGQGISEVKQMNENFEIVDTNSDVTSEAKKTNSMKLADDQYVLVKEENGNYRLIFGGDGMAVEDQMALIKKIKAENSDLANVDIVTEVAPDGGEVDLNGKSVVLEGTDQALIKDPNDRELKEKPFHDKPTPDPEPTPEPGPTPDPEPTPEPKIVPNVPATGVDTLKKTITNLLGAAVAGTAFFALSKKKNKFAIDKEKEFDGAYFGPETLKYMLNTDKSTFNNIVSQGKSLFR